MAGKPPRLGAIGKVTAATGEGTTGAAGGIAMGGPPAAARSWLPWKKTATVPPVVYEKLGSGSYGIVVSPALGNIDEAGKPIEFPGLVSKIMVEEDSFKKAVNLGTTLKTQIPSMAINFTPYRKRFTLKNLPAGLVYDEVRNTVRGTYNTPPNNATLNARTVYVARMPNLGKSAWDVSMSGALMTEYAKKGPRIMCSELLKVIRVIRDTLVGGYVHADIREPNFMINVVTGTMTIIDFDMMEKVDDYYREYPTFYYSHPPEEAYLLMDRARNFLKFIDVNKTNPAGFMSGARAMLRTRIESNKSGIYWVPARDIPAFVEYALNAAKTVYDNVVSRRYPTPEDAIRAAQALSIRTVDTYGLGVACLNLFTKMDERNLLDPKLSAFLLGNLFPEMMAPDFNHRASPEDAIAMLEKFIEDNYPELLPRVPTAADEAARLIRTVNVLGAGGGAAGGGAAGGGAAAEGKAELNSALKVLKRPENNVDPTKLIANIKVSNAATGEGGGGGAGASKGGRRRRGTITRRRRRN